MSPVSDGRWRIHYLGPWTWHTHGQHDGWGFPQRHWGWRLIITARGQRLDVRGKLLDVLEASVYFPNLRPADQCDRCLPGYDGERIPVWSPGELPCEHTRSDR